MATKIKLSGGSVRAQNKPGHAQYTAHMGNPKTIRVTVEAELVNITHPPEDSSAWVSVGFACNGNPRTVHQEQIAVPAPNRAGGIHLKKSVGIPGECKDAILTTVSVNVGEKGKDPWGSDLATIEFT